MLAMHPSFRHLALILCGAALLAPCPLRAQDDSSTPERIEVKLSILPSDIEKAKKAFALTGGAQQSICFFDTQDRNLAAKSLVLRARYTVLTKKGKPADEDDKHNGSTAKLRPKEGIDRIKEARFIAAVTGHKEIGKLEKDQSIGKKAVESLSMESPVLLASTIKAAVADPAKAPAIFAAQNDFIVANGIASLDKLVAVGPILSTSWEDATISGVDTPVDVEEWLLHKTGQTDVRILEISAKISGGQKAIDTFAAQLLKALTDLGIQQDKAGEMKTQSTFNFFLGQP